MATQTYQSEAELENQLMKQLNEQDYASVEINDYDALLSNFREQFCRFNDAKLNGKPLSDKEWERLTNYMLGNSVFESAQTSLTTTLIQKFCKPLKIQRNNWYNRCVSVGTQI